MDHGSVVVTMDPPGVSPLLTTQEVATLLRVSQRTVQDWIRDGSLPAIRYGGRLLRIRQADLAAFGEALNQPPAPPDADERVNPETAHA